MAAMHIYASLPCAGMRAHAASRVSPTSALVGSWIYRGLVLELDSLDLTSGEIAERQGRSLRRWPVRPTMGIGG